MQVCRRTLSEGYCFSVIIRHPYQPHPTLSLSPCSPCVSSICSPSDPLPVFAAVLRLYPIRSISSAFVYIACVLREAELLPLPVGPCTPLLTVSLPNLSCLAFASGSRALGPSLLSFLCPLLREAELCLFLSLFLMGPTLTRYTFCYRPQGAALWPLPAVPIFVCYAAGS